MNRIRKVIVSKKFLPVIFLFFAVQAIFYAWYIGFGIPSDETYHFNSIEYYSHQSITTGPFTHNQDPSTLPVVHAIDRNPKYLYHYMMSFPMRAMESMHLSMHTEVLVLRFINVALAILGLYVLKKCLDEISDDTLVKNFTIFAISMTGMAVWGAGSINYDNLANLLFLLFVLASVKFIKKPDAAKTLLILILALADTLTKYTFLPTLFAGIILLCFFAWQKKFTPAVFYSQLKSLFKAKKALAISLIIGFVLLFGLFVERDVMNLVHYRTIRPACTKFFSVDECRTYNVFNRNYKQKQAYDASAKQALIGGFDPISFSGEWISGMYNTLYFQLGDRRFQSALINRAFAFLLLVAIAVTALLSRRRIRISKSVGYVLFLSLFYLAMVYLYNLATLILIGQKYAYQGRYLLPALGFLYFFTILITVNTYRHRSPKYKRVFGFGWAAVLLLFFAFHFPPVLLAKNTDPSWRETYKLPPEIVN